MWTVSLITKDTYYLFNKMELQKQFVEIAELIRDAKNKALAIINHELIDLYWKIGEYINQKIEDNDWGKSIVRSLSDFFNFVS